MPWTKDTFKKHNKKAVGAKGTKAAAIATSVLKRTGDEGKAIRIANAAIKPK
jgi:uncharacterized protein YdaT